MKLQRSHARLLLSGIYLSVSTLLVACGGGSGGSASTPQAAARSLASLSSAELPSQWPQSFKSATITKAALVSPSQLAATTNASSQIYVQVWYLNAASQRQTLAVLTLASLDNMGGSLVISNIPSDVTTLKSEVYTSDNATAASQLTLANKDIAL